MPKISQNQLDKAVQDAYAEGFADGVKVGAAQMAKRFKPKRKSPAPKPFPSRREGPPAETLLEHAI